jgi:DNA-directed RNA polymerase subunit M/transcription elongation factor TFIIS
MDLSNFIPKKDILTFEIKHPLTGEVLKKDDGSEMTITVYLPHSKEYREVIHEQTNKRIQRSQKGKSIYTSQEIEEATLDLLVKTTQDWNIQLDGKQPKFTEETCREVYDKLSWVRAQVLQAQEDMTSFLKN